MSRQVRRGRFAIAAAAVVAIFLVALCALWDVPDSVVGALGGPTGARRWGGVVAHLRGPHGETTTVELPGVSERGAADAIALLAGGPLRMVEVRETDYTSGLGPLPPGVTIDVDSWIPEDGGASHTVSYLRAATRAELVRTITEARSRGQLAIAPDSTIGYELQDGWADRPAYWRTSELAGETAIDASAIASAVRSNDPNTNRTIVLVDFTRDGAARFCEVTRAVAGRKLATVIGDHVFSAPIINGPICGGRASVTMGGPDPVRAEADADALVSVLEAKPASASTVLDGHWQAPESARAQMWLAGALVALGGALVFGAIAFVLVWIARPSWRAPPPSGEGGLPWRRVVVTLLALLAMAVLSQITLPGVNEAELRNVARSGLTSLFYTDAPAANVIALGMLPLFIAFIAVEAVALVVTPLRWRRHDARGRIALGKATAIVAVAIALVIGYRHAVTLELLAGDGLEAVPEPGRAFELLTALSLAAGTMLLAVIAGVIREHGLGNGYGALAISGSIVYVLSRLRETQLIQLAPGPVVAALVTTAVVAVATACVLRWRIGGRGGEPELRVPSAGLEVLGPLGGIGFVLALAVALGVGYALFDAVPWLADIQGRAIVVYGSLIVFVPVWSWILARPALLARVAMQAGLPVPTTTMWARAAVVSLVLLVFVINTVARGRVMMDMGAWLIASPIGAMLGTAVILDILDEARARRVHLVPAGLVHQIQYLGVIERVLADAEIPCYVHAANLRTLLAFFGPWAPAIVLVPDEHAVAARARLEAVLRASTANLPPAAVRS
jgi:hypothetical protein